MLHAAARRRAARRNSRGIRAAPSTRALLRAHAGEEPAPSSSATPRWAACLDQPAGEQMEPAPIWQNNTGVCTQQSAVVVQDSPCARQDGGGQTGGGGHFLHLPIVSPC